MGAAGRIRAGLPALASVFLASGAWAGSPIVFPQFSAGMSSAGLLLGVAQPTANDGFADLVGPGPEAGLQWLYYPWDWAALGAELGYVRLGKRRATPPGKPFVTVTGEAAGPALTAIGRVNLLRDRSWTPFVLGGAGVHFLQINAVAAATDPGGQVCFVGTTTCAEAFTFKLKGRGLTMTAGAGLEAMLFRGMSLALEARWRRYEDDKNYGGDAAETLSYQLGTRVQFGLP